jgi:type II secretory pathway pseudopilin PulG
MIKRGDTIIEVILAVTIFSAVAVAALTLMNSGTAISQRSLETTLVRHQVDSQAEMLRFISSSADPVFTEAWDSIKSKATSSPVTILDAETCPEVGGLNNPFVILPGGVNKLTVQNTFSGNPDTFARVTETSSQGISIQLAPISNTDGSVSAYDAYIQACWYGPGSSRPMTIGTIVRIYDTSN